MHPPNKIWNTAVIGLGRIGLLYDFEENRVKPSSHVLAYKQNPSINLVGAVDVNSERRDQLLGVSPNTAFYTDVDSLLREQQVDIVSICTPPSKRLELINKLLQNSNIKAIFCEKPLCENPQEAVQLAKLLKDSNVVFIPNLSRRWNSGIKRIKNMIQSRELGQLLKIQVRYTRGIYNTGAHLFDLIRHLCGEIDEVRALGQVYTTAERENDPSYSFSFQVNQGISGYAEAFNDQDYYIFEMDFYFTSGKIELYQSGDHVRIYRVGEHPLFNSFQSLHLWDQSVGLLEESNLKNAVAHLVRVIEGDEEPICRLVDGIYPLYVAEALKKSYENRGSLEKVACMNE